MTHEEAIIEHALHRLWERFGIAIGIGEYRRICRDVESRLDRPCGTTPTGKPVYDVKIGKAVVYAGWHNEYRQVGTFHRGDKCCVPGGKWGTK